MSYLQKNNIRYIKADWTNRDNDILKALTAYGRTGVPLYLYWKPGLNETKILPAVLTEELLLNSLKPINNSPSESSNLTQHKLLLLYKIDTFRGY